MVPERLVRTGMLLGEDNLGRLKNAKVAIFGIGGVGGYVAEALARSGVGKFVLVDNDTVNRSNINRQIIALESTLNQYKVDVMKERILDINPEAEVEVRKCFFLPENAEEFDFCDYSYVVDAVDTVTAKLEIICRCKVRDVPVISSMGTGNKLDPSKLVITDIYKTNTCPLAKVMRHELRKRDIKNLKVVYSTEEPRKPIENRNQNGEKEGTVKRTPGSIAFVPPVAGLILAGEVVRDLTEIH